MQIEVLRPLIRWPLLILMMTDDREIASRIRVVLPPYQSCITAQCDHPYRSTTTYYPLNKKGLESMYTSFHYYLNIFLIQQDLCMTKS